MVSMVSRTGRTTQRYNRGSRLVVGCIPYRFRKSSKSSSIDGTLVEENKLEVLLISSQKGQKMMFPKGGWEMNESMDQAAVRETREEAGVVGRLRSTLGKWSYYSKRNGAFHEGYMFPLLVTEQLEHWPEKNVRQRKWMTVGEAKEVCTHGWMKEALDLFFYRLTREQPKEEEEEEDETPKYIAHY